MDFGDILDAWDEETAKPRGKSKKNAGSNGTAHSPDLSGSSGRTGSYSQSARDDLPVANPLDVWLKVRCYGQGCRTGLQEEPLHVKRRRLRAMRSEASIDLHGLTREEAWIRLKRSLPIVYGEICRKCSSFMARALIHPTIRF